MSLRGTGQGGTLARLWETVEVLGSAGMLNPSFMINLQKGIKKWGSTPAGGFWASAQRRPDDIGLIDEAGLFRLLATNPARLLGLNAGRIAVDAPADVIVVDVDAPWKIDSDRMVARAGNTPFDGLPVQGKVRHLLKGGQPVG